MRVFVAVSVLFTFLAGCGGGGGGGGGEGGTLWPTKNIGINDSATGNLTAASVVEPDGSYVNLYSIVITATTTLDISLESADFDTYLYLLEGAALAETGLNNWVPIAENDDRDLSTTDSLLSLQLNPGTYVIAVNSVLPATGAYTLTTSTPVPTLSRPYVQNRTYELPTNDRFQAWIDVKENGALLQPGDLLTARLFNPIGTELTPTPLLFVSQPYTVAAWDPASSMFGSIATDGDSGYSFNLSVYTALSGGLYTFEVDPASGGTLTTTVNVPIAITVELPAVASSLTNVLWNSDNSLTLSWVPPPVGFHEYRVVLADVNGNTLFIARVLPGVTSVTLQPALVAQISAFSQIPSAATIFWTMQTRNYDGDVNYARSISDPVPITWP